MIGYGRGGGGGGFGGFPYRSAHQQGQDGRGGGGRRNNNNNNNNRNNRGGGRGNGSGGGRGPGRGRQPRRRNNIPNNISYSAELDIPSQQRGIIVGKGGAALRWLKEVTGTNIFVPHVQRQERQRGGRTDNSGSQQRTSQNNEQRQRQRQDQYPIRVNANDIYHLIHAFCEISSLLSQTNLKDPSIPCLVRMRINAPNTNNSDNGNLQQPSLDVRVEGKLILSRKSMNISNNHLQESLVFQGSIQTPNSTIAQSDQQQQQQPQPQFQLFAHVLETTLEEDDVATIVDNVRFVDDSTDTCQWYYREVPHRYWSLEHQYLHGNNNNSLGLENDPKEKRNRRLVFIFGSGNDHPEILCREISDASNSAWLHCCFGDASSEKNAMTSEKDEEPNISHSPSTSIPMQQSFSIGTYNLLHPTYALKYHDPMGVNALGRDNWKTWRAPAIAAILQQSALDVYFLQEVDVQMTNDLFLSGSLNDNETETPANGHKHRHLNQLGELYDTVQFTHPIRKAQDGVAIAVKKSRFSILESAMVPYQAKWSAITSDELRGDPPEEIGDTTKPKIDEHYMCAATAIVRDRFTNVTILLACVHFYDKKCVSPQKTLLEYLDTSSKTIVDGNRNIDAIIWGGDCNKVYGHDKACFVFDGVEYKSAWYPKNKLDGGEDEEVEGTNLDSISQWNSKKKIDWIFYRPSENHDVSIESGRDEACTDFMARTRDILESTNFPPSDHLGVAATISITRL